MAARRLIPTVKEDLVPRAFVCLKAARGGLATTDLLKLKRGQDFRPRGRKRLKPREQIGVPFKAPWSLTRADPSKQPSNAFKTDTAQARETQNPVKDPKSP